PSCARALSSVPTRRASDLAWLIQGQSVTSTDGIEAIAELAQAACRWWEGRNSLLLHVSEDGLGEEAERILHMHDPDEVTALGPRSEEHTSELQSSDHLVCR